MRKEQRIVGIGAVSGIVVMVVLVWLLTKALPNPVLVLGIAERLSYALGANVLALIPFFVMLVTVGNARFLSRAIDPMRHEESKQMEVDARVIENTLQQQFIFFVASMGLSTVVPQLYLQVVWAVAIVFVIARGFFWLGYRISPLYRAPGMAATGYLNLFIIAYVLWQLVF